MFVLQVALAECNGLTIARDGSYGPVTETAVTRFQQANHPPLAVDGVYGPQTGRVLRWPAFLDDNGHFNCTGHFPGTSAPNAIAPDATTAALAHCTDFSVEKFAAGQVMLIPSIGHNTRAYQCALGSGDSNAGVFVLQVALHHCNRKAAIERDGIYGPLTQAAVTDAQKALKVRPIDGVYGPITGSALAWPVVAGNDFSQVLSCAGRVRI